MNVYIVDLSIYRKLIINLRGSVFHRIDKNGICYIKPLLSVERLVKHYGALISDYKD
jgi:hypothetical protein